MINPSHKGLLIVYTGEGKGKTTAALGSALRALGHGWKGCMVQFIKGTSECGEIESVARLGDQFELHQEGAGFYRILDDNLPDKVHREAAAKAVELIIEKLRSEKYDLVIADELNVAYNVGLVDEADFRRVLEARPGNVHFIITGRGAPGFLIDKADLVTEMKDIKHPHQRGAEAQPGIDY